MKTKKDQRHRLSLTMLFTGVVFCFLLLTMLIVSAIISLLMYFGVIEISGSGISPALFILIIALASIVIGTILSATAGRIPLRSVNTIINAMNRLASGDFRTRLSFGGPLGNLAVARELSGAFNKMAAELENTELLRSDFINNFSHEFKTPIVSIAGFAKLMKRGGLSNEERLEYLDIIEDESLRLSYMATNVLKLTGLENRTILSNVTRYNLSEQLRSCVLLLENKWMKKNLDISLDIAEHYISGDEELLADLWLNLLDNAVKFSPEFGTVEVTVDEEPELVSVHVANYGSDIPPESREHIFQKFYQTDESHAAEGSGIGLAIARRITDLHSGTIRADSRGGRTVFTVELPKQAADTRKSRSAV